jgi:hypothetical protein
MRVGEDLCVLVGAAGPVAHVPAPVWGAACVPPGGAGSLQ